MILCSEGAPKGPCTYKFHHNRKCNRSHSRLWGVFFFFGWHHERSSDWLFGRSFCLLFTVETNETGIELRYLGSKHTWLVRRKRRLKRPILDILFCLFCVPKIIDPFQETQSTWDSNPSDTPKRGEYPESVLIQASPIWMQFRLLKGEGWCTLCAYTNVSSIHITHRE